MKSLSISAAAVAENMSFQDLFPHVLQHGWSALYALYASTLPIGYWLPFWCAFIGNANCMRAVFTFCRSCEHQAGKIRKLLQVVQQKALLATEGSAVIKIPNNPQCTLPHRPIYQILLSIFLNGYGNETTEWVTVTRVSELIHWWGEVLPSIIHPLKILI